MSDQIFYHATPKADVCDHDWSGEEDIEDDEGVSCGSTTVCVKCGMTAFEHSLRYGD